MVLFMVSGDIGIGGAIPVLNRERPVGDPVRILIDPAIDDVVVTLVSPFGGARMDNGDGVRARPVVNNEDDEDDPLVDAAIAASDRLRGLR
jgi:hypothetical protein